MTSKERLIKALDLLREAEEILHGIGHVSGNIGLIEPVDDLNSVILELEQVPQDDAYWEDFE